MTTPAAVAAGGESPRLTARDSVATMRSLDRWRAALAASRAPA